MIEKDTQSLIQLSTQEQYNMYRRSLAESLQHMIFLLKDNNFMSSRNTSKFHLKRSSHPA